MSNKFAVFILSHGRADRVYTYKTLRKHGYTGDIYIVCDDSDKELEQYKEKYEDKVLVFNKAEQAKKMDTADLDGSDKVVVFARNVCFEFAKK